MALYDDMQYGDEMSAARRGMLQRQAYENLSDFDQFVATGAGGLGLTPDRIQQATDGTGNHLLVFRPGDPYYGELIQRGMVQPGPDGTITIPSNMLSGALPGYGIGEADDASTIGPMLAAIIMTMGAASGAGGAVGAAEGAAGGAAGAEGLGGASAFPVGGEAGFQAGTYGGGFGGGAGAGGGLGAMPEATYVGGGGGGGEIPLTMSAESAAADASYGTLEEALAAANGAPAAAAPYSIDPNTPPPTDAPPPSTPDVWSPPTTPPTTPPSNSLIPGIPNNVLSGGLQAGLGYLGAEQQADAYRDVSQQNLALGAPHRARLDASYQPGFDLMSQPGYGDAFNRMADISARQWSTRGNPANNPGIQGGILSDVWNQSYLPAMSNYRGQLGQFGGLGLNTAGAAQLGGAQNAGSGLDAIGYGLGTALSQQPDWGSIFGQGAGGQNPYVLNVGGNPWGRR